MAHSVASWALLAAVVALRPAQGLRQLQQHPFGDRVRKQLQQKGFLLPSRCVGEHAGRQLCWEGSPKDPRFLAICGGDTKTQSGSCKDAGYEHDVSGASVQRFAVFLGLTVYAKDSTTLDDFGDAVVAGGLQNNGLCEPVKMAFENSSSMLSDILAQVRKRVDGAKGCAGRQHDDGCIDALTEAVVDFTIPVFFGNVERALGIKMVRGVATAQSFLPEDSPTVPQIVKDLTKVTDEILPRWDALVTFATGLLKPLLTTAVRPIMKDHSDKLLVNVFEQDSDADNLKIGDHSQDFLKGVQADLTKLSDHVESRVESWCK